jgi:hypothetical protein
MLNSYKANYSWIIYIILIKIIKYKIIFLSIKGNELTASYILNLG